MRFKDNIWEADSASIESLFSKKKSSLYVVDVYIKYAWVKSLLYAVDVYTKYPWVKCFY